MSVRKLEPAEAARLQEEWQQTVQQLVAARGALEYVERTWPELTRTPELLATDLSHVREAREKVEATYVIRLFSQFEAILRDHLAGIRPGMRVPEKAEHLVNRVASRL